MQDSQVSHTALIMAYFRGYHAACDAPRIFDDSLAWQLLGEDKCAFFDQCYTPTMEQVEQADPAFAATKPDQAAVRAWCMQRFLPVALTVSRARYAEDCLETAVREGAGQYVILGAGLDTFAFRRPELLERLRVFEVDHPATQDFKRRRLDALGWDQPDHLHFLGMDFGRQTLGAALAETPFDPCIPTFVSWLGVTFYLTRESVCDTLRDIAGMTPAGSHVVFDYFNRDVFDAQKTSKLMQDSLAYTREHGEPIITGFDPSAFSGLVAPLGWSLRENLSPEGIEARFFQGRDDVYHAYEQMYFAKITKE